MPGGGSCASTSPSLTKSVALPSEIHRALVVAPWVLVPAFVEIDSGPGVDLVRSHPRIVASQGDSCANGNTGRFSSLRCNVRVA